MAEPERWTLTQGDHLHVVEVEDKGWGRRLVWTRDGEAIAELKTSDEKPRLIPDDDSAKDAGALGLRFGWFGPARRVTRFEAGDDLDAGAVAAIGLGGTDFTPEPGTKAAAREAWIHQHPRLYTARQTLVAAATVIVPLLLVGLLARFAFSLPAIPWPDWNLPSIPWPDIGWPSIPWPDLPAIPWPDVDISLPGWVHALLDKAKYVWPVLLAFAFARGEIRRRRKQDEIRRGTK